MRQKGISTAALLRRTPTGDARKDWKQKRRPEELSKRLSPRRFARRTPTTLTIASGTSSLGGSFLAHLGSKGTDSIASSGTLRGKPHPGCRRRFSKLPGTAGVLVVASSRSRTRTARAFWAVRDRGRTRWSITTIAPRCAPFTRKWVGQRLDAVSRCGRAL